jgi:hypothetical protein
VKAKRGNLPSANIFRGDLFEEAEIYFFSYRHDLMLGSGGWKMD